MGLAGACGVWETGFDGPCLDPSRVVMCGVRDVDAGEQVLLETHGVSRIERPSRLADALAGREVFVHLDLDVLDPSVVDGFPFPVPGGLQRRGAAAHARRGRRGRDRHRGRGHELPRPRGGASSPPRCVEPLFS